MDHRLDDLDPREERLNEVLGAYLEAADGGWAPDEEALARRYPDLADDLHAFFAAQSHVAALAYPRAGNGSRHRRDGADTAPLPTERGTSDGAPIGAYESLQLIKAGGMGAVYKAWQKGAERWVALKKIKTGRFASQAEVRRFLDEAQAAANLAHPHIVEIYQVGAENGEPFFSMKLFEHGTLQDHLERYRDSPRAAAELLTKVARAVHYAHQRGILHRDLKPANILLDAEGQPFVADFGLAKRLDAPPSHDSRFQAETKPLSSAAPSTIRDPKTMWGSDAESADASYLAPEQAAATLALRDTDGKEKQAATPGQVSREATRIGTFVGSKGYAPPEQAGVSPAGMSTAADVYSLGAILYKMLTGKTLFDAASLADVIRQIKECAPEPPRKFNPKVDARLESICLKCLQKEPTNRYGSAEALAEDLERWLKREPPLAWPMPWPLKAWRASRRYLAVGLLACLFSFSVAALFFIYYYFDPERLPRALEAEARAGKVSLIGPIGKPRWSRWSMGEETVMIGAHPAEPFSVTTLETGRLELLRQAPGPRYRFSAEVLHKSVLLGGGSVGIYFGYAVDRTDDGPVHYWWDLNFADVGKQAQLRRGPDPTKKYGEVMLSPRRRDGQPDHLSVRLTDVRQLFLSAVETGVPVDWRRLAVEVTPDRVHLFWEDKEFADLTHEQLRKHGEVWKGGEEIVMREVKFKPDGGLGIFVNHGRGLFRNVTVEPLQ